jgi:putative inorganic carbon (HCO3(-)) transporter
MMRAIVLFVIATNGIVAIFFPWIGIVLAYLVDIMAPQYIWWWSFQGLQPSFWILAPTMLGFSIAALLGKVRLAALNTKLSRCMMILWLCAAIAYWLGPYVDVVNQWRFYDPEVMFSLFQKTMLCFFVAIILLDSSKKLKVASLVVLLIVTYMTYWANAQYFLYHRYGRLHGPISITGQGIYYDQNDFAVLFVAGFPFLYYLGEYLGIRAVKWVLWFVTIFSWHAIFLTASRGAVVGVAAILLAFAVRSRSKMLSIVVVAAFGGFLAWQGGTILKDRLDNLPHYQRNASAEDRLAEWSAAISMMERYPLTGVGFASFGQAFPRFSKSTPHIAHNTFFQIGGEWGIIAGTAYMVLMLSTMNRLRLNGKRLAHQRNTDEGNLLFCVNEACLFSLVGFFTCAWFLSLEQYELFYYLLAISNATLLLGHDVAATGVGEPSLSENGAGERMASETVNWVSTPKSAVK